MVIIGKVHVIRNPLNGNKPVWYYLTSIRGGARVLEGMSLKGLELHPHVKVTIEPLKKGVSTAELVSARDMYKVEDIKTTGEVIA